MMQNGSSLNGSATTVPRAVTILGSTGSIGCSTLDLVARNREAFYLVALTANTNVNKLIEQALAFRPDWAVIADPNHYQALKEGLASTDIHVAAGADAVVDAARQPADWVMAAIVGAAGLAPTLAAVERGCTVALANKECLVCAGDLMMQAVQASGATLLPVDSEHNAIFQVFDFDQAHRVSRILLTASGGPFRTRARDSLTAITPAEAVKHPNWSMGAKISVDSATMMNKGLELIEAHHLFPVAEPDIEIIVHPQSVIHSMVEYCDGSVLAQLGSPDMRTPIAYCLAWPDRMVAPAEKLDFAALARLDFEAPDIVRFPALRLAREALRAGGAAPAILNAANEIAVDGFLKGHIPFLAITDIVEHTLAHMDRSACTDVAGIVTTDQETRRFARQRFAQISA